MFPPQTNPKHLNNISNVLRSKSEQLQHSLSSFHSPLEINPCLFLFQGLSSPTVLRTKARTLCFIMTTFSLKEMAYRCAVLCPWCFQRLRWKTQIAHAEQMDMKSYERLSQPKMITVTNTFKHTITSNIAPCFILKTNLIIFSQFAL